MAPVAKRNFCRRHDHGMSAKAEDGENHDEEDENSMDQSESTAHKDEPDDAPSVSKDKMVSKEEARAAAKGSAKPPEGDMMGSSLDVLSKAATSSFLLQSGQGKRKRPALDDDADDQDGSAEAGGDAAGLSTISKKRRSMWSALLVKRPRTKDPRHLSSWLNEVLTVSDFETPLDQPDPSGPTSVVSDPSGEKNGATPEKAKKEPEDRSTKESQPSASKEKKNGEKEKKKKKIDSKSAEDGSSASHGKAKKEEKQSKKSGQKKNSDGSEKKSSKKSATKDSPTSKKDSEDGFVGSFADWRDRKKEKALSKKGGGSLRK